MYDDKKDSDNLVNNGIVNDERRGLNETAKQETARNNYQNDQPTQEPSDNSSDTNTNGTEPENKNS